MGSVFSAVGVVWLAATLAFFALRVLPGDAITAQLAQVGVPPEEIEARRAALGLTDPLPVQYGRYLLGLVRADLGTSLLSGLPVADLIGQQLGPTVTLAVSALAVAVAAGLTMGVVAAVNVPALSRVARFIISVALSTPIYWTGTLAIYLFSVQLALLPSSGAGRVSQLILPALVLGFHTAGAIARVMEASARETLGAEFVRTARAKGLPEWLILGRHVLRAALLPVVPVVALQAGFLLGGAVITEALFTRPGVGRVLLDATVRQDYPVVQGVVVVSAVMYATLNAAADIVQGVIDPRVRAS